jgi:predicted kinase
MSLDVPELALVVLVGISGSGKSTFAGRHFAPTQVLSSDVFRAMLTDDENDQSATADAFDLLHRVVDRRLRTGRLTVVDATNIQLFARTGLLKLAHAHDVPAVAIIFDIPEVLCWERTQTRTDRHFDRSVLRSQQRDLRRSLDHIPQEHFRAVHVLHGREEVDTATVTLRRLRRRALRDRQEPPLAQSY